MKLRNVLLTLVCLTLPLHADTIFKKLTREPALPPELSTDVDVIGMPRTRSTWNPLNFPPYRVAKYHWGTKKTSIHTETEISWPPLRVTPIDVPEHSRRHDSFRLNEGTEEVISGECIWREVFGRGGLQQTIVDCTFAGIDGQPDWTLVFSDESGGHLKSGEVDLGVQFMFVDRKDRLIGDLPGGYLFTEGDVPVAALQMKASAGATKLTLKRSIAKDQRRAVAAAVAVLVIGFGPFSP